MQAIKKLDGFTLFEVLLVLALAGVIGGMSLAVSTKSLGKHGVTAEAARLRELVLLDRRTAAMANEHQSAQGVFIDNTSHSYILFRGNVYVADDTNNRSLPFTSDDIRVIADNPIIIFERLSGNVTQGAGEILITSGNATTTLTVRESGQLNW
jgi:prepilin-type N-terminal cleavage/methylation domain-containing protein